MAVLYCGLQKVTPVVGGGGSPAKYGCTIDNLLGDVDANGVLQLPVNTSGDIVFTGVKDVADYSLYYRFANLSNLSSTVIFPDLDIVSGTRALNYTFNGSGVTSASFPKLVTVGGGYSLNGMFYECPSLTSVSLPKLTTISGQYGCANMLYGCPITSISLPELTTISANYGAQYLFRSCGNLVTASLPKLTNISVSQACTGMFNGCTAIEHIYFNALTTTSFGSYKNQFNSMMSSTSNKVTHTIHFPSNLQTTVSGLTGYPNFGGGSGYVTLSFDLPATS